MNFKPEKLYLTGQKRKIVEWIAKNGSITPMDAIHGFSCTKLATRIGEIERRSGYCFNKEMERTEETCYMRYSFARGLSADDYMLPEDPVVAKALAELS